VFLYKGKPWINPQTAVAAACRRAAGGHDDGVEIIGHKTEHMHWRYNTTQTEDLHEAAAKLQRYRANTLITHASDLASGKNLTDCNSGVGA